MKTIFILLITLICSMVLLLALTVFLKMKKSAHVFVSKRKYNRIFEIIKDNTDKNVDNLIQDILPHFRKGGSYDFIKMIKYINKIVLETQNDSNSESIYNISKQVLSRIDDALLFNDRLTEANLQFLASIKTIANKEAAKNATNLVESIRDLHLHELQSNKNSAWIDWAFKIMEFIGFILALVGLFITI